MAKDVFEQALEYHAENRGKLRIESKVSLNDEKDLSLCYTPGVAQPCIEISKDEDKSWEYTSRGNMVAVITDGTAVLGLGDIGPKAAMPVMEGKSLLFKKFANIDSFPLCVDTKKSEEFIETVERIAHSFGGINLEDIAAPRCFEIEHKLQKSLSIPVFHDDQHGTAIVVVSALLNTLKLTKKSMDSLQVVINGAGAAGIACAHLLLAFGVKDIILCDRTGTIYDGRKENMASHKVQIAKLTNLQEKKGKLKEALEGADVFIGVSQPKTLTKELIHTMNEKPIIFALSNPIPEIMPDEAKEAGASVVCTGRSDFANQVNNALVFPGIFRGALDAKATKINEEMKKSAAIALADLIPEEDLTPDYVIPKLFDPRITDTVAKSVREAAKRTGDVRDI